MSYLALAACAEIAEDRAEVAMERAAFEECRRSVRARLVSPATAEFTPLSAPGAVESEEYSVAFLDDSTGLVNVTGWVDSQNRFGGVVRSIFFCDLKETAGGEWVIVGEPLMWSR